MTTIILDGEIKKKAQKKSKELGLSLSAYIRMLISLDNKGE